MAGTSLKPYRGNLTISKPGTVIRDALITGCVVIQASHVTIENTKIVCVGAKPVVRVPGRVTGAVLNRVELDGEGIATVGLEAQNCLAEGLNIYDTGDGAHLGGHTTLRVSFIHDLARQANLHHDVLQTAHGSTARSIMVLGNTLLAYTSTVQNNNVYHLGSGAISGVLVAGNFMDGGHYMIETANGPTQHNIVFRANTMGRHYHYGLVSMGSGTAVSFVGNIWQTTGRPATPANSRGYGLLR